MSYKNIKILTDLHTHTVANTHAFSTVTENATYAAGIGMEAIAITDHAPQMPDGAHRWHFLNSVVLPEPDGPDITKILFSVNVSSLTLLEKSSYKLSYFP